jgi:hypothetical protein
VRNGISSWEEFISSDWLITSNQIQGVRGSSLGEQTVLNFMMLCMILYHEIHAKLY